MSELGASMRGMTQDQICSDSLGMDLVRWKNGRLPSLTPYPYLEILHEFSTVQSL